MSGADRGRRVRARGRTCARSPRPPRGELGGEIVLVFADRACPALDWAAEQGIDTALVPGGDDAALAETLAARPRPTSVVLAGYMRLVGPAVLAAFAGRILNTHPSLLPAFPGAHAVRDALAHGVDGHRLHRPPRRRHARRRADRRPGGRSRSCPATTRPPCTNASGPSSTGCCRGPWRCSLAGALGGRDGRHVRRRPRARPTRACRLRAARCCPCRTRPASSRSPRASSGSGSSSCRPAARPGPCARRACRSPTSRP